MRGHEERDELITSALRSYAEPGDISDPHVVLAALLERAQAEQSRSRRIWAWAMPITVCAMAALVVGILWMLRVPQSPQVAWTPSAPAIETVKAPPGREVTTLRQTRHRPLVRIATVQPERLPKLDVFPSPRPLTPGEQALTTLARPTQAVVTQQVLEAQKHIDDPIDIADLKIRPLKIGDDEVPPTGKEKR